MGVSPSEIEAGGKPVAARGGRGLITFVSLNPAAGGGRGEGGLKAERPIADMSPRSSLPHHKR